MNDDTRRAIRQAITTMDDARRDHSYECPAAQRTNRACECDAGIINAMLATSVSELEYVLQHDSASEAQP